MLLPRLATLGGLRLEGAEFQRPKPLLLLAYLAIEGPQSRRHLAELFWHDAKDPMASLRVALTRIRAAQPELVRDDGPRIATDAACDASALLEALDRSGGQHLMDAYPGPFLDGLHLRDLGLELEEWVYKTREILAARVRSTLLAHAARLAERGDALAAARAAEQALDVQGSDSPEPEELVRAYPLLTTHRPARAKRVATELAEFGIEPEEPRGRPAPAAASAHLEIPHNLPNPTTAFVGRTDELATIGTLLGKHTDRLITLLGPAGVGKTRLSIQTAHEALQRGAYPDGIYWIGLDAVQDPIQVPEAIADAVGLTLQGSDDPEDQVVRYLGTKRALLVLDNYEQLLNGDLLPVKLVVSCPNVSVLVTSRARLSANEERVVPVTGLDYPAEADIEPRAALAHDAVRLFTLRAQRSDPAFRLDEDSLPHVIHLCHFIEGAPLGLELAASWIRSLRIEEIVAELGRGLARLPSRSRDVPDRHRSLDAALTTSWNLLSDRERTVLRRLAVCQGGFRRDAAADIADATLPILANLVDASLLRLGPNGRYDRHPLVHQFSRERLAEDPDEERAVRDAHGRHYRWHAELPRTAVADRNLAARLFWRLETDTSIGVLEQAREEMPNLHAAWHHYLAKGDAESIYAVAVFHGTASEVWGRFREGRVLFEAALERLTASDNQTTLARALVAGCLAVGYWRLGRLEDGAALGLRALASLEAIGADDAYLAIWWAAQGAGINLFFMPRFEEATKAILTAYRAGNKGSTDGKNAFQQMRSDGVAGLSAVLLSMGSLVSGDLDLARAQANEAMLRMKRSMPRLAAYASNPLVLIADAEGDYEGMIEAARDGIEWAEKHGHDGELGTLNARVGIAYLQLRRSEEALHAALEAVRRTEVSGDQLFRAQARAIAGRALLQMSRRAEARDLLVQALCEATQTRRGEALAESLLGCAEILEAGEGHAVAARIAASLASYPAGSASCRRNAADMLQRLGGGPHEASDDLLALVPDVETALKAG